MHRSIPVLVAFSTLLQISDAQPFTDIAAVSYQYHLPSEYRESNLNGERDMSVFSADVLFPFSIGKGSYAVAGGQYARFDFGFGDAATPNIRFNVTEFRAGMLYQWRNQKDKTLFLVIPKWSGDGKWHRSSNFQMGCVVLHTHQLSSSLALKAGLYYNREFFGHFFMPLGGLEWKINEKMWLYGTLPGNLQFHRIISPSVALSVSYVSPSGSLLFENGTDHVRIGRSFPPNSVLSIDAHWRLAGPLTLRISVGHSLWRSYGAYTSDEVQYAEGSFADYKDGLIVRASIIARVFNP